MSFLKNDLLCPFELPIYTWVWGHPLRHDGLIGGHTLKKTHSPSCRSHQLSLDPQTWRLVKSLPLSLFSQVLIGDLISWAMAFFFFLRQGAQAGLEFVSLLLQTPECTFIPNYFLSLSLFLLFWIVWDRVPHCSLGWPRTHYVTHSGLELMAVL